MSKPFKILDLFSGIGGFSLGLERAGMETAAFCECDPYARKILARHWPGIPIYEDVKKLDGRQFKNTINLVCGGFPCQDVSTAASYKRSGLAGARTSLYSHMLRIISDCRPKYAIFENVPGLLTGDRGRWFAKFLYDLAAIGYDAEWHCISASYIGAPHHRDRVWIIAYPDNNGQYGPEIRRSNSTILKRKVNQFTRRTLQGNATHPDNELFNGRPEFKHEVSDTGGSRLANRHGSPRPLLAGPLAEEIRKARRRFDLHEPPLCRKHDGVSHRVDRIRCLGNAVVPVIPEAIGRAILEYEKTKGLDNEPEHP